MEMNEEYLTARLGKMYMVPSNEVVTTSEAADKHLRAFEQGCEEWMSYHSQPVAEEELEDHRQFVLSLLSGSATWFGQMAGSILLEVFHVDKALEFIHPFFSYACGVETYTSQT
eukprot:g27088.t1